MPIPQEFTIGGVYLPPLLIAALLGLAATSLTARLLDRLAILHPHRRPDRLGCSDEPDFRKQLPVPNQLFFC